MIKKQFFAAILEQQRNQANENISLVQCRLYFRVFKLKIYNRNSHIAYNRFIHPQFLSSCQASASGYLSLSILPGRHPYFFGFRNQLALLGRVEVVALHPQVGWDLTPTNMVRFCLNFHQRQYSNRKKLFNSLLITFIFTETRHTQSVIVHPFWGPYLPLNN